MSKKYQNTDSEKNSLDPENEEIGEIEFDSDSEAISETEDVEEIFSLTDFDEPAEDNDIDEEFLIIDDETIEAVSDEYDEEISAKSKSESEKDEIAYETAKPMDVSTKKSSFKGRRAAIGTAAAAIVVVAVVGLTSFLNVGAKQKSQVDVTKNNATTIVTKTDIVVTETDNSFDIEAMSNNVIGTGVLYTDADVYKEASSESEILGSLESGTTLLVYAAEGDYYKASDAENTISGYVLKEKVNTGGIDIGNPDAALQIVDADTGKIVDTVEKTASNKTTNNKTANNKTTSSTSIEKNPSSTTGKKTTAATTKNNNGVNPADFPVNSSPYFIYVEKGSHTITIYAKDGNGKYTSAVRTYLTATGRTSSLTPVGSFKIGSKEKWHSWGGKSYSPYCSKYYGGLFFHGPLYNKKNFGTLIENSVSQIGTNASSGCMRTSADAAYFIYAFCPSGTNVKIVNGSPLGRRAVRPSVKSQYVDPATNAVPAAGISFSFSSKTIEVGDKFTATVTFNPASTSNKVCTWKSSSSCVSLSTNQDKCTITGKSAGTATITATSTDGSYTASFKVVVKAKPTTTTTSKPTSSTSSTTKQSSTSNKTTTTTRGGSTSSTKSTVSTTTSTTQASSTTSTTIASTATTTEVVATTTNKTTTKNTKTTKTTKATTKTTQTTTSNSTTTATN